MKLFNIMQSAETLEEKQERLQNTGGTFSDSDEEDSQHNANSPAKTSQCSGITGCGQSFPSDEVGADFKHAELCANCYKEATKNDSSTPLTGQPPPPANTGFLDLLLHIPWG